MRTFCSGFEIFTPLCNLIRNKNSKWVCVCLDAHGQMYSSQSRGDTFEIFHI
jgi:hypothetical protein